MASLPVCLSLPGTVFVHAGLRPGLPLERQSDADMMWIREPFLGSQSTEPSLVVHGHTPAPEPEIRRNRIGIDTGAFATGRLTAVRLSEHAPPAYLSTT
jgi:serine/threonine protein phosphatase 1